MANMIHAVMPMRTESAPAELSEQLALAEAEVVSEFASAPEAEHLRATPTPTEEPALQQSGTPVPPRTVYGWPVPSCISANPEQARACIQLPAFDDFLIERARVISSRFPFAEAEYRHLWGKEARAEHLEIPHFERVFRIAARIASVNKVEQDPDYDALLILTAWHSVRPGVEGFLGSYPKALLCPLSHTAPPTALASLSLREQATFERRVPFYLRYLLCDKFGLRTCADIENADLRRLLRSTGFRLFRSSAVAEVAFPGSTRGEDPPV